MLISWNDKSEREGLFQPMKSQIDSYTVKWKNIVILQLLQQYVIT